MTVNEFFMFLPIVGGIIGAIIGGRAHKKYKQQKEKHNQRKS